MLRVMMNPRSAGFPFFLNALALYGACCAIMYPIACGSIQQADADIAAIEQAITKGAAVAVAVENLACEVATDVDPSGATATCVQLDAAGNAVSAAFTTLPTTPAAVAALVASTAPKTPAVAETLRVGHAALKVRKLSTIAVTAK